MLFLILSQFLKEKKMEIFQIPFLDILKRALGLSIYNNFSNLKLRDNLLFNFQPPVRMQILLAT